MTNTHKINKTFDGPEDTSQGFLTNYDFIIKILEPKVFERRKAGKNYHLYSRRKSDRIAIGLEHFVNPASRAFAKPLKVSRTPELNKLIEKNVKIADGFYSEFNWKTYDNLDASRQYYVLLGLNPVLSVRTEQGSDECGFVVRDAAKGLDGKLEHWAEYHDVRLGKSWTAHIKLRGKDRSKLITKIYKQVLGNYASCRER